MICIFRTIPLARVPLIALLLLLTAGCGNDEDRPVAIQGLDAHESPEIHISETGPLRRTAVVELLEQWAEATKRRSDGATKAEERVPSAEESSLLDARSSALDSLIDTWLRLVAAAPASELRVADLSQAEFDVLLPDRRLAKQQILVDRVGAFRRMTDHLLDRATQHMIAGEHDHARAILVGLKRWGNANARDDLVHVLRLSGKAVRKHAEVLLNDLRDLEEPDET